MEAVYIHIPFCKHICSYCDFPKVLHIDNFVDDYLEALHHEIEDNYEGERIKTLYIGGGSPSCLTKDQRIKLFRILEIFNKDPDYEYTFECNPEDITEDLLDDIVEGGVNRVSIGIESFDPDNLNFLERKVDYKDIENKLDMLRKRGINNINLDLMYALPNEKLSTLKKDIKCLINLEPTHISTYSLIIEKNTKLSNENTEYINEDLDRKMYDYIVSKLEKKGYKRYEVSNFAKEGYESLHNLNYWNNLEYYGFGLGASGYKANFRYTNTKNIHDYSNGKYLATNNLLTYKEQMDNEIMLGFRKVSGINVYDFMDKYDANIQEVYPEINNLLKTKELIYEDGNLFINPKYIYTMNEILIKLI